MSEWKNGGGKGAVGCPLWPAALEGRGRDFWRRRNEERKCRLPNEDFLPFLILYTSTSYKEIMPSAPKIITPALLLTPIGKAPYPLFMMHLYPTSMVGSMVGRKSKTRVYIYLYTFILVYVWYKVLV